MNITMNGSGRVVVNGKTYNGKDINIKDGKVFVDGVSQDGDLDRVVNVEVYGDVERIESQAGSVKCNHAGSIKTGSGDVFVDGPVSGSIKTGSGDVDCGKVEGKVSTGSGDIKHY